MDSYFARLRPNSRNKLSLYFATALANRICIMTSRHDDDTKSRFVLPGRWLCTGNGGHISQTLAVSRRRENFLGAQRAGEGNGDKKGSRAGDRSLCIITARAFHYAFDFWPGPARLDGSKRSVPFVRASRKQCGRSAGPRGFCFGFH